MKPVKICINISAYSKSLISQQDQIQQGKKVKFVSFMCSLEHGLFIKELPGKL